MLWALPSTHSDHLQEWLSEQAGVSSDHINQVFRSSPYIDQPSVLAHSAVRAFVTHGGINAIHESVFAHTPMVVMPLGKDQGDNAARAVDAEIAVRLSLRELGVEAVSQALSEVLGNESYNGMFIYWHCSRTRSNAHQLNRAQNG